jgi:hypothetical protein
MADVITGGPTFEPAAVSLICKQVEFVVFVLGFIGLLLLSVISEDNMPTMVIRRVGR